MASPFPGMDPYLESPQFWRGVHQSLITYLSGALNAQLPPGYAAKIDERVYIGRADSDPDEVIYPDVAVSRPLSPVTGVLPARFGGATTSVLDTKPVTEPETVIARPQTVSEIFIEVLRVRPPREIVTIIEVLSPSNKIQGSAGRESYITKQQQTLQSETNLLEIDLLRQGAHTVAPPAVAVRRFGAWNYLVSLHRPAHRYAYDFWRISLRSPLPGIRIPLAPGDVDVIVDLQTAFTQVYDTGPFPRVLDYTQPPDVPLTEEDAAWADTLLRDKGLR